MLFFYLSIIDTPEEKSKFEMIYYKYRSLMYYIANGILQDHFLAEDAVQNAFLKIIPNIHKIGEVDCVKTKAFVVIVVENVSKRMYTKRKKQAVISFEDIQYDIPDNKDEVDKIISDLTVEEIVQGIKELSKSDSEILMLRYVHDLTAKEIAKLLEIKEANVRKRLERARRRLAEKLQRVEKCNE